MRLTIVFLTVSFLQVGANGFGQKINLNEKSASLEKVFREIEKQSGYVFVYKDSELENVMVSINIREASLEEALNACLDNRSFIYHIIDKTVVIRKNNKVMRHPQVAEMKVPVSILITGKVTDKDGTPLPGTSVKVKDGSKTTLTDTKGDYAIEIQNGDVVLVFSFIGFKKAEYTVGNQQKIDVVLQDDIGSLDEVMVVGYGTSSRRSLTGSVVKINSAIFEKQPLNDPIAALQGRVSGLQITNTSGLPGSNIDVRIRGVNSLKGGSAPLYIVDGVPFVSNPLNAVQTTGLNGEPIQSGVPLTVRGANLEDVFESPFKSINPADIESIEILKDADATAIYGARGANGVILITTKRGKPGQTTFSVDAYTGISQVPRFIKMNNTQEYLDMRQEAFRNDQSDPLGVFYYEDPNATNAPDLTVWDTTAYTNWAKKFTGGTAHTSSVQSSLSGGNDQTQFMFNGGFRTQSTVFGHNYGLTQGSVRLNLNHGSKNKKFTTSFSTAFNIDKNNLLANDPSSYYDLAPNFPLYTAMGSLNWSGGRDNPLAGFLQTLENKTNNLMGSAVIGYQLLPDLRISSSFGYNRMQMNQLRMTPIASLNPSYNLTGTTDQSTNSSTSVTVEPQANYNLQLGKGRLEAMIGGTYLETYSSSTWINATGYTDDRLLGNLAFAGRDSNGYPQITVYPGSNRYRYLSTFGRVNYNLENKYIVNLTFRRDGSSRFGANRRFGNFGAVGAAWVFSEESFLKNNLSFLGFGKLRGSYGTTGNDQIANYMYYDTWNRADGIYQTQGTQPTKLNNSDYGWETNRKLEAALELGFWQDRISLTVSWYRNRSGNQLLDVTLPGQSGFTGINRNWNALIENSGNEVDLAATVIKSGGFMWNTSLNVSFQNNKLLKFPGLDSSAYRTDYRIGQSISNIRTYKFEGIDPQTGKQLYADSNNDGEINQFPVVKDDRTIIGNRLPAYYGGFNQSFSYKGFQLDIFFSFRKLDKVLYRTYGTSGSLNYNEDKTTTGRWQKPGDQANFPRYSQTISQTYLDNALYLSNSDRGYYNGSYIRLSNVSLAYNLSQSVLEKLKFRQIQLYVLGQNLFTHSHFPGTGPETGVSMAPLRTITGGLKISL